MPKTNNAMVAQTYQLPENTIQLLKKYAKKENNKNKKEGKKAATKQGIVNEAILEKVAPKKEGDK